MKAIVIFDFPSIADLNNSDADQVVERITGLTRQLHDEFVVEHPDACVYVDEVTE